MGILSDYRIGFSGDSEIVIGVLEDRLVENDPRVVHALEEWEGTTYVAESGGHVEVVMIRPARVPRPRPWLVHSVLLLLTLFTTHMAGALLSGVDPMGTEFLDIGRVSIPVPTTIDWRAMALGAPFALTLMCILTAHEMGHFLLAHRHRIRASLPYFIPFPAYYSAIGTLGAFIRIRGPIVRRSALLDIGVSGPLVSFVLSIVFLAIGLGLSGPVVGSAGSWTPFAVEFAGQPIQLGSGLLAHGLAYLFFPMELGSEAILLHPIAFAAWLGLFVTCLNLLPFGQLDGGHVLYALSARVQRWAAPIFLVALLPLGRLWVGWWLWAGVAVVLSRGRLTHPPVLQPQVRLAPVRTSVAWLAILIFFLTFVPVPVHF